MLVAVADQRFHLDMRQQERRLFRGKGFLVEDSEMTASCNDGTAGLPH